MSKGKPKSRGSRSNGPVVALILGAVALIGLMLFQAFQSEKMAIKRNEFDCNYSPKSGSMPGVEFDICKGAANHVAETETVTYTTDPPLWGNHHGSVVKPGFYTESQKSERLVHNLEHGNVVIYYDKAKVSESEMDALRVLTESFPGTWDGVIAVPRTDPDHAVILTAWEYGLRLEAYDKAQINRFLDLYRGRGPEQPVR